MLRKYENIGVLPLAFPDGQEVESGEVFHRDFDETTGSAHERFLMRVGCIRVVDDPVPSVAKGATNGVSGSH